MFQATAPNRQPIHRKKLFGGRETAQDVHRKHAWPNARCYMCGSGDVVIRLSYYQSPFDLIRHEPRIAAELMEGNDGQLPIWRSTQGPLVMFWVEYACRHDQQYVERQAAKLPDYIRVDIDRGVGEDKAVVQVPL